MPHRNAHHRGSAKGKPEHKDSHKRQPSVASKTMKQEFPSYEALDEQRPGSLRGEHRADTGRMGRKGGAHARRSEDEDDMPARGEDRGLDDTDDFPARGESAGSSGSLWQEGETPVRGESRARGSDDLTWSGFARPSRGESSGEETRTEERADRSGPVQRGEGTERASGGFIEPDERVSGSSRRH